MAYKGPSDRTIEFDVQGGTLTDITTYVRELTGVEDVEAYLEEVTGPGDTTPQFRATGFEQTNDFTMVLDIDVGGTYDAEDDIGGNMPITTARSFKLTYSSGKYATCECFPYKWTPVVPVRGETSGTVVCKPTGAWTVVTS